MSRASIVCQCASVQVVMGSPIRVEYDTDRQTDSAGTGDMHGCMGMVWCMYLQRAEDEKGKRVVSNGGRGRPK